MDFLKKIAPTLAAALMGPAAGLAVDAIGKAFGWEEATKEKVEALLSSGKIGAEDLAKIKLAELEIKRQENELGFKFAELASKDVQAEHHEQQETIRSGDNAEDPYVRHTRPRVARQSWYGLIAYVAIFEGMKAYGHGDGANLELAMLIASPVLAYIGFRSMFDKTGLFSRFTARRTPTTDPAR